MHPPAAAQKPLVEPVPLARSAPTPAAGGAIVTESDAARALAMGFPSVAANLYAELIAHPGLTASAQARLVLGWSISLLEDGQVAEARTALAAYAGSPDAAYQLRLGLAALAAGELEEARAVTAEIELEELEPAERPWLHYLHGLLADEAGDVARATASYARAIEAAGNDLQRARFALAGLRAQLRVGPVTEAQARTLAQNVERFQGRAVGHDYAKQYAAVLAALGRESEAVTFLQRQLLALPAQERAVQDDFRLLLGIVAGAADGVGRNALSNLLASGANQEKQRVALQLLASSLPAKGAVRDAWREELGRLIGAESAHPILGDLLLYRAQLALADNRYTEAEQDAQAVLERFPASQLRPAALGVLLGVAWERERFRQVAGYATDARRQLAAGDARAQLGVLVAEAFFRAGDYRSAADAYGAALGEIPPGVPPGDLMFQQVLAQIEIPALDAAAERLDDLARNPQFDVINRWRAEWNLARALQVAGRTDEAYRRADALVGSGGDVPDLPRELAVRLAWLRARLAVDAGQTERALDLASALRERLSVVAPDLRAEVASSLALVEAAANFALERSEVALEVLRALREAHPGTDAAVYSYIVEADAYSARNQLVEAQRLLTRMVDDFPDNRYAPFALYQAALNAERRGEDTYLEDAIRLIERLVNTYPQSELVFYARFKQGDILRKLNQFGSAVQIYEDLVNNHGEHHDVYAAELARADVYAAQAATDASQLESATAIYERLQVLPAAAPELRIEAGFKRGHTLQRRGAAERAQGVWWEVVNTFLLGEDRTRRHGARGRYWLSRTLLELARSLEATAKLEDARNAYDLILQQELPGDGLARAELARITGAPLTEAGR